MATILGGFLATLWTSSGLNDGSDATNIGIVTRVNPQLDPGNIESPGTGERGLYDIQLGTRDARLLIDMNPTLATFISTYQNGQSAIPYLHLKFVGGEGMTFVNAYINTISVEGRASEAIAVSIEFWPAGNVTYPTGVYEWNGTPPNQNWLPRVTTPKRWLDSVLSIAGTPETEWHSWRYEVANNLQRLPNVATGGTRAVKGKQRRVTGTIVKDLDDFDEVAALINLGSEAAKFNITITLGGTTLLNCNSRWGRLEDPYGPEDLILKRFPFTALDLTNFTP